MARAFPKPLYFVSVVLFASACGFAWLAIADRDHHALLAIGGIDLVLAGLLVRFRRHGVYKTSAWWTVLAILAAIGWYLMAGDRAFSDDLGLRDENTRLTLVLTVRALACSVVAAILRRSEVRSYFPSALEVAAGQEETA